MGTIKDRIEQDKKEEYVYKKMLNYGWKPHQAAAIVGNIKRESNFDTSIKGTADTKGSMGISQWHSDRLDTLKKKYGSNWTDLDNQLEFVNWELNNTHKSAGDALKQSKGVWDAGRAFTDKFERPKVGWDRDEKRQTYVTDAYRKYSGVQLTPEDQANFLKGTAQRAIDNYEATYLPNITVNTPQISNLESPLGSPTLAEDNEEQVAAQNQEVEKAKMELQQKQNEENLFNDLLKASQLAYVDPNQVSDYTQAEQEQQFQNGGVRASQEWLQNWYKNRTLPDPALNQAYQTDKQLYVNRANTVPAPIIKETLDNKEAVGAYDQPTDKIYGLSNMTPENYTHEGTHYVTEMSRLGKNTQSSMNDFLAVRENILPSDKIQDPWTKENYPYLSNYQENQARLNAYRQRYNLQPTQEITPELIKSNRELYKKENQYELNTDQLYNLYNDEGLSNVLNKVVTTDNGTSNYYGQNGGVIKDDNGYWNPNNWGKVVEIGSNRITMKGVNEPLYAVPDVGEPRMLFPNQEYIFPGATKVTEHPIKNKSKRFS